MPSLSGRATMPRSGHPSAGRLSPGDGRPRGHGRTPERARDLSRAARSSRVPDPSGSSQRAGGEPPAGHLPVMLDEVAALLAPAPGSLQVDATLGGGGHAQRILTASAPDGRLLGLDADPAAIARVRVRLEPLFGDRLVLRQANFQELAAVAPAAGFGQVA